GIWRSPLAWGMSLMFGMTSLITYTMFTWLPKLLAESGGSEAFGGTMTALFSALGLLGALLVPGWAVRVRNPFPLVAACVLAYLAAFRSEEHTSELQSRENLVCRLLLEKK